MALRGSYITACSEFLFFNFSKMGISNHDLSQTKSTTSTILLVRYVLPSLGPRIHTTNMTTMSIATSIIRHDLLQNVQDVAVQF